MLTSNDTAQSESSHTHGCRKLASKPRVCLFVSFFGVALVGGSIFALVLASADRGDLVDGEVSFNTLELLESGPTSIFLKWTAPESLGGESGVSVSQ